MKLISANIGDTGKIARNLAVKIVAAKPEKHAKVIALEGELGAGKTTFVKSFARTLGIKSHLTSPTFVLMKSYKLPTFARLDSTRLAKASADRQVIRYKLLIHIDAYRLKNYSGLLPLGIKEAITEPTNIIVIEWSDRVRPILPHRHINVHIDHLALNKRRITIS